ncbi:MAG: arsenosugar biosynthesis radical SAM protein ArsS [Bacteroidota bacterium]|nr:arsenosugar biosynthesis radical SAM protein ArsS [Bacteroidota bacterium]
MAETAKSLKSRKSELADGFYQLDIIGNNTFNGTEHTLFSEKLIESGLFPLKPTGIEIFQINVGKMCNQTCRHCHVDAGPDRKEIMTRDIMSLCLEAIKKSGAHTVDLTGGAPEMNPDFRWFVEEISKLSVNKIIVRCNLTIILANPKYHDLPEFFKRHHIEVVSSLPYFTALKTDAQRGDGVFDKSIRALQMLNSTGYGMEDSDLILNLVYNPSGAFLPGSQATIEAEFKKKLLQLYGIHFNSLYTITNLPISRFLEYLLSSGNYNSYMEKLIEAYNSQAAMNVMCRNTLSVGWDGFLYDCDFNQMLDLKIESTANHVSEFNTDSIKSRSIIVNQHCFGCTAGAGSSCGGATS